MEIIKIILNSLKKRGFPNTVNMIIAEWRFDKLNKVDTSEVIKVEKMDVKIQRKEDCKDYMPPNAIILEHIFNYLKQNYDLNNSSLLDYRCGKGRAAIYAHKFGLKKIIGVDFANELCLIAKKNIDKLMLKNIEIFHQDASTFTIPDDTNIFYFFNPFDGDIMQKVINNIDAYIEIFKEKILIVYVNPLCKGMFIENNYNIVYKYKDEVIVFDK